LTGYFPPDACTRVRFNTFPALYLEAAFGDLGPEDLLGGLRVEHRAEGEDEGNISCFLGLEPYAPSSPWLPCERGG
jgi:hypothetical protein